jgi:hypothetical protein
VSKLAQSGNLYGLCTLKLSHKCPLCGLFPNARLSRFDRRLRSHACEIWLV